MDNFDEFFGAFDGEEAAAVEETPEAEETVDAEDPAEESQPEEAEESVEEGTEPAEDGEDAAEQTPAEEADAQDQTFTVDDQQYSLEEMTDLARKGTGYDDLQARLDAAEQAKTQLQTQLDNQQGAVDILNLIAQQSGKTIQELAKQMYVNFRGSAGLTAEAAALELENAQLKKQVDAGKPEKQEEAPEKDARARAKQELADFRKLFPKAILTDEVVAKLKPDVQKGMSLANAYQKMLNDQKAAELAEQQRKLEARNQNDKNKRNSPGSQQDSGGRREKSKFDDFFSQFK